MSIARAKLFSWSQITILGLLIIVYLIKTSPDAECDTTSYLSFSPVRPPLYPIFLWFFHGFGAYQFTIVMWIQSFLSFLSLLYTRHWLHTRLKLSNFLTF